ncbi:hypothetical protein U2G91_26005 (plasmid) [Rhodococcoides fascians]|uniref:hypothetical protein n=1 Tax=Nocardiaceae TaxID=85025 RepID=UPI001AE151CA|nr:MULTISPECIES: hypothetical protein [Rhodococcus]MBP2527325.1 hypothetical protein [Rhodococcus sp. PvP104]WQH31264.1 hypothetical protein U2G91_26005 [Rhodococcus fascians]
MSQGSKRVVDAVVTAAKMLADAFRSERTQGPAITDAAQAARSQREASARQHQRDIAELERQRYGDSEREVEKASHARSHLSVHEQLFAIKQRQERERVDDHAREAADSARTEAAGSEQLSRTPLRDQAVARQRKIDRGRESGSRGR